jgi:uncharacterized protein YidB (DUF937 family)
MGAQLLSERLGLTADSASVTKALEHLLGDGHGHLDLPTLTRRMASTASLQPVLQSWLRDGRNRPIAPHKLTELLGEERLRVFARQIETDPGRAAQALSEVLPQLVDKASSGGNLLASAGGLNGLNGLVKLGRSLFRS